MNQIWPQVSIGLRKVTCARPLLFHCTTHIVHWNWQRHATSNYSGFLQQQGEQRDVQLIKTFRCFIQCFYLQISKCFTKQYHYTHLTDREIEVQRSEVICPKSLIKARGTAEKNRAPGFLLPSAELYILDHVAFPWQLGGIYWEELLILKLCKCPIDMNSKNP